MDSSVPKEFGETCGGEYNPDDDNSIFMKEELIITDVANQLDNDQANNSIASEKSENINNGESQTDLIPNNVDAKLEESINKSETVEEDDIVVISEEIPTKKQSKQKSPKQSVIIPEIVQQMMKIKSELQKGNKVPNTTVFIKKCRICQKVQKESRTQSMIKCQECDSKCFLFQCLLCFKRYTTVNEVFAHIDKKHADKVYKENMRKRIEVQQQQQKQQQPSKGIKVKSNKCLNTNEKFKFNINGLTPVQKVINEPSTAKNDNTKKNKEEENEEEEEEEDEDSPNASKVSFEILLNEDIPLKEVELSAKDKPQIFRCNECDYTSPFKRYYHDHMMRRHMVVDPKNYFACSACQKSFKLQKDYNAHAALCGKAPHLKCKFCEFKTRHTGTLNVHMQTHMIIKTKAGELESSLASSSSQSNGSGVKKKESEPKNAATNTIDATVAYNQEIANNHLKSQMQAYCAKCERRTKISKRKQCAKCKSDLQYRCKQCAYSNASHAIVQEHVLSVHFAYRPKPCPNQCGKLVMEMKAHLKYCGVEPGYSCKYCPFKTKHKFSYNGHMQLKHSTDRNDFHQCSKCGKRFAVLRYLQRHQRYYCDTEPAYGCAHCSLKTRSKANLVRHLRLLHMETMSDLQFNCNKCGQVYRNVYMYDKHVKQCVN